MVSRDFQALNAKRALRAHLLSERYAASCEVLSFYAELIQFQGEISARILNWEGMLQFRLPLIELVRQRGPQRLREAADQLDENSCRKALTGYWKQLDNSSLTSFFARALLQAYVAANEIQPVATATNRCPRCGHLPQVGVLQPQGEGNALKLACSLCFHEWPFPRGYCVTCGENEDKNLVYYTTREFDHLQVQACETCLGYLHAIDLTKEPEAVPDVDELVALPLDIWAQQQGYHKFQANLAGI